MSKTEYTRLVARAEAARLAFGASYTDIREFLTDRLFLCSDHRGPIRCTPEIFCHRREKLLEHRFGAQGRSELRQFRRVGWGISR
jgi:hypothetical protein